MVCYGAFVKGGPDGRCRREEAVCRLDGVAAPVCVTAGLRVPCVRPALGVRDAGGEDLDCVDRVGGAAVRTALCDADGGVVVAGE